MSTSLTLAIPTASLLWMSVMASFSIVPGVRESVPDLLGLTVFVPSCPPDWTGQMNVASTTSALHPYGGT